MAQEIRTVYTNRCDACSETVTTSTDSPPEGWRYVYADHTTWLVCGEFCANRVTPDPTFDAKAWLRGLAA